MKNQRTLSTGIPASLAATGVYYFHPLRAVQEDDDSSDRELEAEADGDE